MVHPTRLDGRQIWSTKWYPREKLREEYSAYPSGPKEARLENYIEWLNTRFIWRYPSIQIGRDGRAAENQKSYTNGREDKGYDSGGDGSDSGGVGRGEIFERFASAERDVALNGVAGLWKRGDRSTSPTEWVKNNKASSGKKSEFNTALGRLSSVIDIV